MILTPPDSPLTTPANFAVGATSPFVTSNERSLLEMLTRIAASGVPDAPDRGAGFTGTGLRGSGIADVTRDDMNLGPQAGLAKSFSDLAAPAQTLADVARGAAFGGPVGMAIGIARSPAGLGLMSNIANYSAIAAKTAAAAARGGEAAAGGLKGNSRPGPAGPVSPDDRTATDISGLSGPGMNDAMGAGTAATGGAAPGTDDANSNSTATGQDAAGPGESVGLAKGGLIELAGGGKIATGPGGGMDDLIPTSIDGARAAALSDGEFVIPADVVSMMGDGSTNAGSKRLYDLVREIREAKTGRGQQASPLQFADILRRTLR